MKIFIDSNIIVDLLAKRELFYQDAVRIFSAKKPIERYASTITVMDTLYILENHYNLKSVKVILQKLLSKLSLIPTYQSAIEKTFESDFKNLEDAAQYFTALEHVGIDYIITRDIKGFANSTIPVLTPTQFILKHIK
jgi:predicted nucleic acid-binding protein